MSKNTNTPTTEYTILRKDQWASQEELQATFDEYVKSGLNLDEEIKKLIEIGYIKKS